MSLFMAMGMVAGCGPTGSGRGESCRARNDCASGLYCISNVCVQQDFAIAPTTTSCDLIECAVDSDCCSPSTFPTSCPDYRASCDAGDTYSCNYFQSYCVCHQACRADHCEFTCTTTADCGSGDCVGGRCVQCTADTDCFGGETCQAGACRPGCVTTADCPYFNTCMGGQCVETGCTTDRECVAASRNPRALCHEGECSLPCENDAECNPGGYAFQECQAGSCVYVGCATNEECRIFLNVTPGSSSRAVCR